MSNPNYGMTGYTALAVERAVSRKFKNQWSKATPLLAMIESGQTNFNKGFQIAGSKMLLALAVADASAAAEGVFDEPAGVAPYGGSPHELAAITPVRTNGATQSAWEFSHYRMAITLRESEKQLIDNSRGNILQHKVNQLYGSFRNRIGIDMWSATTETRAKIVGLPYVIAAANNPVGGIDQTANAYWRRSTASNTAVGVMNLMAVNNLYDGIVRESDHSGKGTKPDLLLLSFNDTAGSVNVYGRLRELIAPAQQIVNAEFQAKYGFDNIYYLGMNCVLENRAPAGTAWMLSTGDWYYGGGIVPKKQETIRLPGTDADEMMYTLWACIGCDQIRTQGFLGGITS